MSVLPEAEGGPSTTAIGGTTLTRHGDRFGGGRFHGAPARNLRYPCHFLGLAGSENA